MALGHFSCLIAQFYIFFHTRSHFLTCPSRSGDFIECNQNAASYDDVETRTVVSPETICQSIEAVVVR